MTPYLSILEQPQEEEGEISSLCEHSISILYTVFRFFFL